MLLENLFQLSGQRKWQTHVIISSMQFGRLDEIIVTEIKSIEFTILGSDSNQFKLVLSNRNLNFLSANFEMWVTDLRYW